MSSATTAPAGIITEYRPGGGSFASLVGWNAITAGGSSSWNNLKFNFYSDDAMNTPAALEELDVYTAEYTGTQQDVGDTANLGWYAKSSNVLDNVWQFTSGVVLNPNTPYWFYAASQMTASYTDSDTYAGGVMFVTTSATDRYAILDGYDLGFSLQGDVETPAVPERSTLAISLMLGAAGLITNRIRRKRKSGT